MNLTRIRSLSDTVAPAMRILVVGLNPSPYSADHSIGYARPGNRFWPAALAAGIVSIDRDPLHAVQQHGIGMPDLVRRHTARADQPQGPQAAVLAPTAVALADLAQRLAVFAATQP